jgi:hypothetical protein
MPRIIFMTKHDLYAAASTSTGSVVTGIVNFIAYRIFSHKNLRVNEIVVKENHRPQIM